MDDLISRQQAIDAMAELQGRASTKAELKGISKAWKRIKELQPIQPEPHWIPVEQDLPKENYLDDGYVEPSQPVLVYMNYHAYKISRYWGHRKSKGTSDYVIPDWMDLEEYDGDNVIAWMPLPEPYKEVTE